ncbi:hypothetical protein GEMRC1_003650 [Eukaryota sp. GEM-RC1]
MTEPFIDVISKLRQMRQSQSLRTNLFNSPLNKNAVSTNSSYKLIRQHDSNSELIHTNEEDYSSNRTTSLTSTSPEAHFQSSTDSNPYAISKVVPAKYSSIFPFPSFNEVQNTCFDKLFNTDENVVVSAPTGTGKTTLFEFGILRLLNNYSPSSIRTLSGACCRLEKKFSKFNLKVSEVTGDAGEDSDATTSSLIVTTPEKIDFVTRRLRGAAFHNIQLVIIDEVHHLNEQKRGPVLEAVVSRLKLNASPRFIAASATIPNCHEVGRWLGATADSVFEFGEQYRPVPLEKVVIGVPSKNNNVFVFDKFLDYKLFDLISKYSPSRPVLIFCSTRKSAQSAATKLMNDSHDYFVSTATKSRLQTLANSVQDKHLSTVFTSGIASHSAALSPSDRTAVESAFLEGVIRVVCATSTLSIGVNLPAYCVIVKGTQFYSPGSGGQTDYSSLQILQMIGRAGRQQFDTDAVSIILTTPDKYNQFSKLTSGNEIVDSQLSDYLTEHLNAEIAAGIITHKEAAFQWVKSTFYYQRLLSSNDDEINSIDLMIDREIEKLIEAGLVSHSDGQFMATELGKIASRQYISFPTVSACLGLSETATIHELLLLLADSDEMNGHILRNNEKKDLNAIVDRDFVIFKPEKPKVRSTAEKILVLMQCVAKSHQFEAWSLRQDGQIIVQKMVKLLKTIAELFLVQSKTFPQRFRLLCELYSVLKGVDRLVWPPKNTESTTTVCELRQLQGVGPAISSLLNTSGIFTLQQVAESDPRRLEFITNRNSPFGTKLVDAAKVSRHLISK